MGIECELVSSRAYMFLNSNIINAIITTTRTTRIMNAYPNGEGSPVTGDVSGLVVAGTYSGGKNSSGQVYSRKFQ